MISKLVSIFTKPNWKRRMMDEVSLHAIVVATANLPGLQCHTAPFSWKIVFECDHQLYELIMTACTAREEAEWRGHLTSSAKDEDEGAIDAYTTLAFDIKGFGSVFGKPGKYDEDLLSSAKLTDQDRLHGASRFIGLLRLVRDCRTIKSF